jgi:hypothetical protein
LAFRDKTCAMLMLALCAGCGPNSTPGGGGGAGGGGMCSTDGWCWMAPQPTGNTLTAIGGSSASDLWMVGRQGTLLRWDGERFSGFAVTDEHLTAVSGRSRDSAWAVGGGKVLRWDGSTWSVVHDEPGQTFHAVAEQAGEVWVGAEGGMVHHFREGQWAQERFAADGPGSGIYAASPDAVFVASSHGVHRWDGHTWSQSVDGDLQAVWGLSPSDVWAVGAGGVVKRWDGSHWSSEVLASQGGPAVAIAGTSDQDVWVVSHTLGTCQPCGAFGHHWDGAAWKTQRLSWPQLLNAAFAAAPGKTWFVGQSGTIVQFPSSDTGEGPVIPFDATEITAAGPDDVWLSACYLSYHWDGAALTKVRFPSGQTLCDPKIFALAADDVRFIGWDTMSRWDGANIVPAGPGPQTDARAVWGSASSDIWAVGHGAWHWDGTTWSTVPTGAPPGSNEFLNSVAGTSASDVWAVGSRDVSGETKSVILHWDGHAWSTTNGDTELRFVWATARDNAWVAGGSRTQHWDGAKWSDTSTGLDLDPNQGLCGIAGEGANLWAIGCNVTDIFRWSGTAWTREHSGSAVAFRGIAARSGHVWGYSTGLNIGEGSLLRRRY